MIYQYKAILPRNKSFVRIYEVRANSTLYAFHLFLQNALSFAPDQQVFFRTYNASGKQVRECRLFDVGFGSMDQVRLEAIHAKGEVCLHYVFDIFKGRYLELHFDGVEEEVWRRSYPRTVLERGGNPDQFRDDLFLFDDAEAIIADEGVDSE